MLENHEFIETHESPIEAPIAEESRAPAKAELEPVEATAAPEPSPEIEAQAPIETMEPAAATAGPVEAESAAAEMEVESAVESAEAANEVEGATNHVEPVAAEAAPIAAIEPSEIKATEAAAVRKAPAVEPPRATLIPFVASAADTASRASAFPRFISDRRWQAGAAAACLTLAVVVAGATTINQSTKSQSVAEAMSAMSARIDALDAAKPRDEAADIRKAVSEARGGLATSHDLATTIAQLNARLDRLEKEQQGRLDKLAERVDHDTTTRSLEAQAHNAEAQAHSADLATRIDKLEKADVATRIDKLEKADFASRIDKVEKKVATQTATATPTPPVAPKDAASVAATQGVSNDITGSIEKPHPTQQIRGWLLAEMRNGSAVVENRQGLHEVEVGDTLPGAGKIERFEKRGREWVVITDQGIIVEASSYAPRVVARPPMYGGPYGGYGPGYGGGYD